MSTEIMDGADLGGFIFLTFAFCVGMLVGAVLVLLFGDK